MCIAQSTAIDALRYKQLARMLILRKGPHKSMGDLIATMRQVFNQIFGAKTHSLNRQTGVWELPTGSHLELGILPDGNIGQKYYEDTYQGRSYTHITIDEAQAFAQPKNIDLLISNLRGHVPTRMRIAANPGGIGHQWLAQRFVSGRDAWAEFSITSEIKINGQRSEQVRKWLSCPSTYLDNPHNGHDYLANLAASCEHDEELLRAWVTGDWNISRGAYFAAVLDNPRIEINWPEPENWGRWEPGDWKFWLAYDHGTASPAICYIVAQSPGGLGPDGRAYSPGSILLLDEWACHRPGDRTSAYGWHVSQLAGPILSLAKRWRIPARGVADDEIFGDEGHNEGTIADQYGREGIVWRPARKGRRAARFLEMKRMLSNVPKPGDFLNRGQPGFYVSKRCEYWWATVPFIVHDPKDPEVPLKGPEDHGLDAGSYGMFGYQAGGGAHASPW